MSENNIENTDKKKRYRRTKSDLERDVNNAITSLIEEVGFTDLTLTAIAQRAQIEPAVFYRRYANLDELFDEFTKKYDYWLGSLAESIPTDLGYEESLKWILKNLCNALYKNKVMQQLLIWELSSDNPTTRRTAKLREEMNGPLIMLLGQVFQNSKLEINTIVSILISGVYYLILHQERSTFCGVDFSKRNGKQKMELAIEQLATLLFKQLREEEEKLEIANRLRAEGVSEDIIRKCVL